MAIARLDQESLDMFLADPTVYENYVDEVACPMYLDLITTRLDAGYYRSVAHIRHDIGLLLHNFKLFNSFCDVFVAIPDRLNQLSD